MKVALVCDSMSAYGGAERVIEQILHLYPEADLFSVLDVVPEGQRGFLGDRPIRTSFLQSLPSVQRYHRKLLHLWPLAVEQFDVTGYDLVISAHHSVAYGVLTRPGQVHAAYVFSPARYAWDLQHQYLREASLDHGPMSFVARHTLHRMRLWDYSAAQRPDAVAGCSAFVAQRLWRAHRRHAQVIYPPVDTAASDAPPATRGDYYISVGRLVPYKRIDLLARAFALMPERKLKIVGGGPELKKIAALAGPNVEVLGFRPDTEVAALLAGARAFMFAGIEDFGISPVEAQAAGKPVIALRDGGLAETVRGLDHARPTGVFFERQDEASIVAAVETFERTIDRFAPASCIANAARFSEQAFRTQFTDFIDRALEGKERTPHGAALPVAAE